MAPNTARGNPKAVSVDYDHHEPAGIATATASTAANHVYFAHQDFSSLSSSRVDNNSPPAHPQQPRQQAPGEETSSLASLSSPSVSQQHEVGEKRKLDHLSASDMTAACVKEVTANSEQQGGLALLFAASVLQQSSKEAESEIQSASDAVSVPAAAPNGSSILDIVHKPPQSPHTPTVPTVPPPPAAAATGWNHLVRTDSIAASECSAGAEQGSDSGGGLVVDKPSDMDVLCGRGGLINKHPGNVVYRRVVDHNKGLYKQVPKRHRILVSQSIVQTIQNHGGRFLQSNGNQGRKSSKNKNSNSSSGAGDSGSAAADCAHGWTCVPFRRAVQKTSQALREPSQSENEGGEEGEGEDEKEPATTEN